VDEQDTMVLFPTPDVAMMFKNDPRFRGAKVFYAIEGGRLLQGQRFTNIWIHWFCSDADGYSECVDRIVAMIQFAPSPVNARLFL